MKFSTASWRPSISGIDSEGRRHHCRSRERPKLVFVKSRTPDLNDESFSFGNKARQGSTHRTKTGPLWISWNESLCDGVYQNNPTHECLTLTSMTFIFENLQRSLEAVGR